MASAKITELTELTDIQAEDMFVVVDDPTGTPITKKVRAGDVGSVGKIYVIGTLGNLLN